MQGRFEVKKTCADIVEVSITLFKIMIPTLILVKILEEVGVVVLLNQVMAPLTMLMGLPVEMAIGGAGPSIDLTWREHDVMAGLRAGMSNREIADLLVLSEVTAKHHIKSLRGKLGARNRLHAVCRANELQIQ